MIKKYLITAILMFVILPIVYGSVECHVSDDNETWTNISSTLYDGCVDDTNNIASIQNLYPNTDTFIRCRNDTTGWGYLTIQTTESGGGLDEKMIAALMGFLAMGLFFFLLAWNTKAIGLKILGYTVTATQLLMGLFILYINETGESMTEILRINFMLLLVILAGILLIVIANFFIRLVNPSDTQDEETDALKWQGKESKWYKNV